MSILADPVAQEPPDLPPPPRPAPRRLLGGALAAGFVLQVGLRGGLANAVVAVAVGLTVGTVWLDGRLARRDARVIAGCSVVPAVFLGIHASPWLAWANAGASGVLLAIAVLHARHGSIVDSTPAGLLRRGLSGLSVGARGLAAVGSVAPPVSADQRDRALRAGRGLLVTVPVLVVLVALLASADAVFASLLTPDVAAGPVLGHALLTVLFASLVVVTAGATSVEAQRPASRGRFGTIELTTMLGLVGVVLALFVASQVVALTDAGDRLVQSAGLTPAEYARSGFFQLCWATGLLLAFLAVVRSLSAPEALGNRVVVALGAAVPGLALGLVVVSLRRMALYDDAHGLTMLRLAVVGAALWMGAVLVMTALRNLGVGAGRDWLVAGAGLAGVVLVAAANLVDPEAFVARHNLERARAGADLDVGYLATMSDDVAPVVADAIDAEPDPDRRALLRSALRCGNAPGGVARFNLATQRADDLREDHCR